MKYQDMRKEILAFTEENIPIYEYLGNLVLIGVFHSTDATIRPQKLEKLLMEVRTKIYQ